MNPLIRLKKQLHHFSSHSRFSASGFCHKRKRLSRRRTEAIPGSTRQKGKTPCLASRLALRTQQLVGFRSLASPTGSFNTATGAGALLFNTADQNTAFGAAALLFNTTGFGNTAVGAAALLNNTGRVTR